MSNNGQYTTRFQYFIFKCGQFGKIVNMMSNWKFGILETFHFKTITLLHFIFRTENESSINYLFHFHWIQRSMLQREVDRAYSGEWGRGGGVGVVRGTNCLQPTRNLGNTVSTMTKPCTNITWPKINRILVSLVTKFAIWCHDVVITNYFGGCSWLR